MHTTKDKEIDRDEQSLIKRTLEGDKLAFEELIAPHREAIYRLLLLRIGAGSSQDIDDMLQDSFVKAYINLHRYNPEYSFGQWIYTIARNTAIDHYRRRSDDLSIDNISPPEELSPNPEQSVINNQKMREIESCIAKLSPRHQQLFRLRFMEEYSYEEIAQKLQIPIGSVKTYIHRARQQMSRMLIERDKL